MSLCAGSLATPYLRGLKAYALPALAVLLALLLRVYNLNAQSIWFDEGWSWRLARLPFDEMVRVTAADRSPILYYTVLHGWIELGGESPFAMRYLSVCADVVTTALLIAFSRDLLGGRKLPPLTGLLYAVCPFAVWYAQETRMYALVAVLCMASCFGLWRWLHDPRTLRPLLLSAVFMALAVHTHYYAIFLLPASGLTVLITLAYGSKSGSLGTRMIVLLSHFAKWTVSAMGVVAVLLPWLLYASIGFAYDDGFVFPLNTIDGRIGEWLSAFAGGGLTRPLPDWWPYALFTAVVAGLLIFWKKGQWRAMVGILILASATLLFAAVAVRWVYPYRSVFHPRYLIYVVPLVVLLLGSASALVWRTQPTGRRRIVNGLLLVLGLIPLAALGTLWIPALYANYADPNVARDDVKAAVTHVVEALLPGDVVVTTRDNYAVQYYLHTLFAPYSDYFIAVPPGLHGVLKSDAAYVAALNARNPKRVRLFLWQDGVVDPQKLVESTLWANGNEIGELSFGQIRLPLYQVRQHPIISIPNEPISASFGEGIDLTAFWMRTEGIPGDWFYTVLTWRPTIALSTNNKVFVHVLASDGTMVFQRDKLALSDLAPMSTWRVGETISDAYAMIIPADLPEGEYQVVVGVYNPLEGGQRLHAQSDNHAVINDSVLLGTLRVHKR